MPCGRSRLCNHQGWKNQRASAEDLQRFHDAVAKARLAPLPPFPRASVLLTKHIIEHLTLVDQELDDILMALGVTSREQ
jgi:hypothetical protein